MAYPVVQFDSSSGSDSLASGAGPATAVNSTTESTTAATDGAGTTVTFSGATDLSGVATDGSHCIYLVDATVGNVNFSKILTVDDGANSLTVDNAFGLSLSGLNWAIGGKRQFIGSTTSRLLGDNNGSAGDMQPGWVLEMMSGYAETLTTTISLRRAGNSTNGGQCIVRGEANPVTKPVISVDDTDAFYSDASWIEWADFDLDRTPSSSTNVGGGFGRGNSGHDHHIRNIDFLGGSSINKWSWAISGGYGGARVNCFNVRVNWVGSGSAFYGGRSLKCHRCVAKNCDGVAFSGTSYTGYFEIFECEVSGASTGISFQNYTDVRVLNCSITGTSGDGIYYSLQGGQASVSIIGNLIDSPGGYGIAAAAASHLANAYGNLIYNATSGESNNVTGLGTVSTIDPDLVSADDLTPQANLEGLGENPIAFGSTSYKWPGAIQPASSGGGATRLINGGLIS